MTSDDSSGGKKAGPQAGAGAGAGLVMVVAFGDRGQRIGPTEVPKVVKPDGEWLDELTKEQFLVTRRCSTEEAFTGQYAYSYDKGLYRCVCCGNALFSSEAKFESESGWPSFWAPIAEQNIAAIGIEILCRVCEAHLGHVFGDGPAPTGLRFCINSAALFLIKTA